MCAVANLTFSFLFLKVGDILSVIDMPPKEDTTWWRGKQGFQVPLLTSRPYFFSELFKHIFSALFLLRLASFPVNVWR